MIDLHISSYVLVFVMIFIAGFMDAIAGGGGLISLPTYILIGLPPHFALGTNKFSSFWGTLFATRSYLNNKMIELRIALLTAATALIGSWLGARTVLLIKPDFLNYILVFLLPVITFITFVSNKTGIYDNSHLVDKTKRVSLSLLAGLFIGFYDGFFGPGTGTFLILFYTFILHYDYVRANGNTKVVNLSSNFAAMVTFAISGSIYFKLAIPAACFGVAGNLLGSHFVVLRGNKLVRKIFLAVLVLLFIRVMLNIFII